MRCFHKKAMSIAVSLGIGILLGMLLPIELVAGIEALIIIFMGVACCFKR